MATSEDRQARIQAARESFSGRTLTEGQFREAWAVSGVIRNEIKKTGSFVEKLTDYAHAYARSEKFDALRGETILRDIYKARYQQSMNQTREGLLETEKNLPEDARARALTSAESVSNLIKEGTTQPFYKAYDAASLALAGELKVTQSAAKNLMKEAYQKAHDRDLYAAGKQAEEQYHRPVREAAAAERKTEKQQSRTRSPTMS